MQHRSDCLFHFTKEHSTLLEILNIGFRPSYSEENIEWLEFKGDKIIGIPMVCFCDIPLSLNETHIRDFGGYALGMSRKWGVENDINPVRYIQQGSAVAKLYKSLNTDNKEAMRYLSTTIQNIWFVDECEWRYVPQSSEDVHIPQYVVDETLEKPERLAYFNNLLASKRMLTFAPEDIECIVVEREEEIQQFKSELDRIFANINPDELKRLKLSIKSLVNSRIQFVSG